MNKIYQSISECIGNTPLIQLNNWKKQRGYSADIIAKLESFNPLGSVKDRAALGMIEDAEEKGLITKDTVIIEPTSGNTGIGLAFICAQRGYQLVIVMPDSMSLERRKLLSALGAQLVLTDGKNGMKGAIAKANELMNKYPQSFMPSQFSNSANPKMHYQTTAAEIWKDTNGSLDAFVAGVGSGGTITGVGKRLKELNPEIQVFAVEPAASPVLSGGKAAPHAIQGIGAGFVPENYNCNFVDKVLQISNEQAYQTVRELAKAEGILVGISSGAALCAAQRIAEDKHWKHKRIVVLFPDSGERYLSIENLF